MCTAVTYVSIFLLNSIDEIELHPVIVQGLTGIESCNGYQIISFGMKPYCEAIMEFGYGETVDGIYEVFWLFANSSSMNKLDLVNYQRVESVTRLGFKNESTASMIPIHVIGFCDNWNEKLLNYIKSFSVIYIQNNYFLRLYTAELEVYDKEHPLIEYNYQGPTLDLKRMPYVSVISVQLLDLCQVIVSPVVHAKSTLFLYNLKPPFITFDHNFVASRPNMHWQCILPIHKDVDLTLNFAMSVPIYITSVSKSYYIRHQLVSNACKALVFTYINESYIQDTMPSIIRKQAYSCIKVLYMDCEQFLLKQIEYYEKFPKKRNVSFETEWTHAGVDKNEVEFNPLTKLPLQINYNYYECLEPIFCGHLVEFQRRIRIWQLLPPHPQLDVLSAFEYEQYAHNNTAVKLGDKKYPPELPWKYHDILQNKQCKPIAKEQTEHTCDSVKFLIYEPPADYFGIGAMINMIAAMFRYAMCHKRVLLLAPKTVGDRFTNYLGNNSFINRWSFPGCKSNLFEVCLRMYVIVIVVAYDTVVLF